MTKLKYLIGLVCLVLGSTTYAVPVTFTFTGGGFSLGDPITFVEDGLTLNVTGTPGIVVGTPVGLGVISSFFDTSLQVDGFGPDETINFSFSESVQLLSVLFNSIGLNDDGALVVDGATVIAGDFPGGVFGDGGSSLVDFSPLGVTSDSFSFTVLGFNDDFFVGNITVGVTPTAVPEPGTLGLLVLGMLGIGIARRLQHSGR